jgi:hypothetical protein
VKIMVNKVLFWDDVQIGGELPTLEKVASTQMLAKWAAASGDFNPLHYEFPFAESQGVGTPIVHGQLKRAWLIQTLTDWIGENGDVKKFSCQFRGIDYPVLMKSMTEPKEDQPTHFCKGKVIDKYEKNGSYYVEAEIWVENSSGEITTPGKALVALPKRN